ncbi:hypothetical protein [Streptomyces sp. NPDC057694]|uniref:hypothetical protein n=1 Tax=Streptomyces sp. NPDC057694 TaxID=3346216 RepID=UPI0036CC98F6
MIMFPYIPPAEEMPDGDVDADAGLVVGDGLVGADLVEHPLPVLELGQDVGAECFRATLIGVREGALVTRVIRNQLVPIDKRVVRGLSGAGTVCLGNGIAGELGQRCLAPQGVLRPRASGGGTAGEGVGQ